MEALEGVRILSEIVVNYATVIVLLAGLFLGPPVLRAYTRKLEARATLLEHELQQRKAADEGPSSPV